MKKTIAWMLSLVLALGLFSACAQQPATPPDDPAPQPEAVSFCSDYAEAYAAIDAAMQVKYGSGLRGGIMMTQNAAMDMAEAAAAPAEPMVPAPMPEGEMAAGGAGGDHSGTNVQVAGIDEQDIVKTDGTYIYLLRDNELVVLLADGENTTVLSQTMVGSGWEVLSETETNYHERSKHAMGLYIADGGVAVLSSYYGYQSIREQDQWRDTSEEYAVVDLYSMEDPTAPVLTASFGQDGWLCDSRLQGDTLYLVTSWNARNIESDDPGTYVPAVYRNGERRLIEPEQIGLCPVNRGSRYVTVSAINLTDGTQQETQAMLGAGDTVYMNDSNLYLAGGYTHVDESEPYKQSIYTVVDYTQHERTTLTRFDISGGGLTCAATGEVDGYLHNQYSLDEKDGCLRVVTTSNSYSYKIYTDEEMGFTNYVSGDSAGSNGLYILDSALDVVGSVADLAPDERVYSVRFDGDYGYICTFRETDPLFCIDLSDPTAPAVKSALKIPGFSDYLHVWSDGLLFGLGQNTSTQGEGENQWVTTDGMKLSMFDISDPENVTECANLPLDADYSTALYNPCAILVSAARDLIAFPVEAGYLIYGYNEQDGFVKKAEVTFDNNFCWDSRGLYINDLFYVVSEGSVSVIDLNTLALLATIPVAYG